jgi:hypothetical protein
MKEHNMHHISGCIRGPPAHVTLGIPDPTVKIQTRQGRGSFRRKTMNTRKAMQFVSACSVAFALMVVAPAAFGAEADADRVIEGIDDINGDAVPDIAVGDPAQGRKFIFSGADGTLLDTVQDSSLPGETPLTEEEDDADDVVVGDVDGDAVPDVAVEDPSRGYVLVFSGADGTLLYTLMLPNAQAEADKRDSRAEREALASTCVEKTKYVKEGKWRTLEWFVNASGKGYFLHPAGARIKVRCGAGWLGWDKKKQTLDGITVKTLSANCPVFSRMQMKVSQSTYVTYQVCVP